MLLLCVAIIYLTGCGFSDESRAQTTTRACVEAFQRDDRLAVKETVTAKAWANLSGSLENKEPKKDQADFSVGQAVITDDTALVAVTTRDNGKETTGHVKLRREEREWRVYAISFPAGSGGPEVTIDFEHPEAMFGEMFKGLGEAMGAMFKGIGEGMGAMFKGMAEGFQKTSQSAPSSDNAPSR